MDETTKRTPPTAVTGFLLGTALTSAVAWVMWPNAQPQAAPPVASPQRQELHAIGLLQLGPGESVEAVAVPNPDGYTSSVCVVYRSAHGNHFQCPSGEAITP